MLYRTENFPAVTLRLFLTYGPGQDFGRFLPQIIHGCLDEAAFPTTAGEQLRDFCYVEDSVRAILQALVVTDFSGEVFNIGSGVPVSIHEMIEKICILTCSGDPQHGELPYRPDENMALYANISKAKKIFKWETKIKFEQLCELMFTADYEFLKADGALEDVW